MTIEPDDTRSRSDLAGTLKQLRKAAGLSGQRLAMRCAMSQTKISRIETGKALPTVLDVERIIAALDVPANAASELLVLARKANIEHTSLRALAGVGLWRRQAELKALSESYTVQRQFLPAMPTGLMQVSEYARAALSRNITSAPDRDVERTVEARMDRQTILDDTSRSFVFLLTAQAVKWKCADRAVMIQQCAHMAELMERPNIEIEIVPQSATVRGLAALNSFVLYDDRLVVAELFSGDVAMHDYRDITYHMELFNSFRISALAGDRAKAFLLAARDEFM